MTTKEAKEVVRVITEEMARLEREARTEVVRYGHVPGYFLRWEYISTVGGFPRIAASLWCRICGKGLVIKYKPGEGEKDVQGVLIRENCVRR